MSYYQINRVPVTFTVPIGTISAYLGKSSNGDPDGFVIADGVARDNTDGKYNDLYDLGVGSKSGTNYTPPNFKNQMLRSVNNTNDNNIGSSGGSDAVTLSTSNLPEHSHTGTTDSAGSHRHGINTRQDDWNDSGGAGPSWGDGDNGTYASYHYTEYAGEHDHSFTTDTTGSGSAFNIIPVHVKVNYIIKY